MAEAMGAKGIRLEEPRDVKDALAEALAYNDEPVVVDAVIDRFALSLPLGRMDTVIRTMERNVRLV